jgi:hypothetical protein
MTEKLQSQIVTLLRTGLAGAPITNPATQIIRGKPVANPRPLITVYAGAIKSGEQAGDNTSGEPRPMQMREVFPVPGGNPLGPYQLAKTPLDGSALGKLIFDKDGPEERRQLIIEKKDFTIDYPNAEFTLNANPGTAGHLLLEYSFPGIFILHDFQQDFFIEMVGEDMNVLERLASLACTIIFTHHKELVDNFNQTNRTVYSATQYQSEHWINRISWVENIPAEYPSSDDSITIRFKVSGQVKHIREDVSGFGIIESIRTPGAPAGAGVNIVPGLG